MPVAGIMLVFTAGTYRRYGGDTSVFAGVTVARRRGEGAAFLRHFVACRSLLDLSVLPSCDSWCVSVDMRDLQQTFTPAKTTTIFSRQHKAFSKAA